MLLGKSRELAGLATFSDLAGQFFEACHSTQNDLQSSLHFLEQNVSEP